MKRRGLIFAMLNLGVGFAFAESQRQPQEQLRPQLPSVVQENYAKNNIKNSNNAYAKDHATKDHGIVGTTFEIQEEDLLEVIERKLQALEKDGSLQTHQQKMTKEAEQKIKRPKPVEGINHTTKPRSFTFDPSITVPYDLKDHQGKVFHKKGTCVNPLDYKSLSKPLLFIDGEDEAQVTWARKQNAIGQAVPAQIILVNGSSFELMEKLDRPIYFDQEGTLTKKLKITQVPAKVTQKDKYLLIEEILLEKTGGSYVP